MSIKTAKHVTDGDGVTGVLEQSPEADAGRVRVRLSNGRIVEIEAERLVEQDEDSYGLNGRFADLAADDEMSLPLAHEEVNVDTRKRETARVRLHKRVETRSEEIQHDLLRERVIVDRVPVYQELEGPAEPRREGDTLIIPVVEERLIVQKQLVLVEEIHVRRQRDATQEKQEVSLRRTRVEVERTSEEADTE